MSVAAQASKVIVSSVNRRGISVGRWARWNTSTNPVVGDGLAQYGDVRTVPGVARRAPNEPEVTPIARLAVVGNDPCGAGTGPCARSVPPLQPMRGVDRHREQPHLSGGQRAHERVLGSRMGRGLVRFILSSGARRAAALSRTGSGPGGRLSYRRRSSCLPVGSKSMHVAR